MDLDFSPQQVQIRDEVRTWLAEQFGRPGEHLGRLLAQEAAR